MPGRKNPLQISSITERIQAVVTRASKTESADPLTAATNAVTQGRPLDMAFVDLSIRFMGASGLHKMDVLGRADPYFVAKLDDKLTFVSAVQHNTRSPIWNELWRIKNVPNGAILAVEVLDKDSNSLTDDYVGQFSMEVSSGEREMRIEDKALKRNRGTFWLSIDLVPSEDPQACLYHYDFDGPVRFSRHFSPTVGRITHADNRLYATWKVYLKGVRRLFGDQVQSWNRDYPKARSIFQGPASVAVRSIIHTGHRMLYARAPANAFGVLDGPADVHHLLHGHAVEGPPTPTPGNPFVHRIRPALYTYVVGADDDSFRFSETGAHFLLNMASKHALHSDCATSVRYSGEFHPRPAGGWERFDDARPDEDVQWELVVDNKSGTYAPSKDLLPALKGVLELNFPGFTIVTLDYRDPELKKSTDACRAYAVSKRGISDEDLQPHAHEGKETLVQRATNELHKHGIGGGRAAPDE